MDYNNMALRLAALGNAGLGGPGLQRRQQVLQTAFPQAQPQATAPAAPAQAPAPDYSQWSPNQVSQDVLRGLMPPQAQGKPTLASFSGVPYQWNPGAPARQAEIAGLNRGTYNPVLGMKR